jgi:hypothetical protein
LQAGTRSFIGDIDVSHHISITNHHRGPWVKLLTETLPEVPKWTSITARSATRAKEIEPEFNSGKSTQPNCCVPYPAGCIVLDVIIVTYHFHDDRYLHSRKRHLDPADL